MQDKRGLGRIAIVGAGAVGCYYGARLAKAGEDVVFLMRSDIEAVRRNGLKVMSVHGDFTLSPVACFENSEQIGTVDWVIVAWKATSNSMAKEVITPLIGTKTKILTLQNGLGNCEYLAELFGKERVFGGLCFVCINRLAPGIVSHTASGLVRVGSYANEHLEDLDCFVKVSENAGFPCELVQSLEAAQWMKLIWNVPFNGLAIAEGGVDTSVLLKQMGLEGLVRGLMQEVAAVARALGHEIEDSFVERQIEITYPMGAYKPSSMIDYIEGREVEYEAIWGEPLRRAYRLGVEVPLMEELALRIRKRLRIE